MIRNSRRAVTLAIAGAVAIAPVITGCGAGSEPQTAAPTQLTDGVNVTLPRNKPQDAQIDIRNMFLLGPKPATAFGPGSSLPLYATVINQVKGRQDRLVGVSSPNFAQVKIAGGAVALPPAQSSGEGSAVQLMGNAAPSPAPSSTAPEKPGKKKKDKPGAETSGSATPTAGASATPTGGTSATPTGGATPEPTGAGATPSTGTTPTSGSTPSAPTTPTVPPAPEGKAPLVVLTGLNRQLYGGEQLKVRLQFEQAGSVDVTVPVIAQQNEFDGYTAVSAGTPVPGGAEAHPSAPEGATSAPAATPSTAQRPEEPASTAKPTDGAGSPSPAEGGGH
ncbi:hypothetical protein [Actinomadura roseirufa]|uniref:hypothetical protein n=1 Tax=Actinomadura roseirufa TaxID=2094049 RepID=UPI00104185BE|nr:hypothetical protein [Actinomadura roseirufa]